MFYVYEHYRPDINAPFYVGKGNDQRVKLKVRNNVFHHNIRNKLKRNNLNIEIKVVQSFENESEAFAFEKLLIETLREAGVELANKTDGGEGISGYKFNNGAGHSIETRLKMSMAAMGRKMTPEALEKMKISQIKRLSDPAVRKNISEKVSNPSAETRQKMRMAKLGKTQTEEHKLKNSLSKIGKKDTEEVRKIKSDAAKLRWAKQKGLA